jgi:hypothetical protein
VERVGFAYQPRLGHIGTDLERSVELRLGSPPVLSQEAAEPDHANAPRQQGNGEPLGDLQ